LPIFNGKMPKQQSISKIGQQRRSVYHHLKFCFSLKEPKKMVGNGSE